MSPRRTPEDREKYIIKSRFNRITSRVLVVDEVEKTRRKRLAKLERLHQIRLSQLNIGGQIVIAYGEQWAGPFTLIKRPGVKQKQVDILDFTFIDTNSPSDDTLTILGNVKGVPENWVDDSLRDQINSLEMDQEEIEAWLGITNNLDPTYPLAIEISSQFNRVLKFIPPRFMIDTLIPAEQAGHP